jgi:hypothetical protein
VNTSSDQQAYALQRFSRRTAPCQGQRQGAPLDTGPVALRVQSVLLPPLSRFVVSRLQRELGANWAPYALGRLHTRHPLRHATVEHFDSDLTVLFNAVLLHWRPAFRELDGRFDRVYFEELRGFRNAVAHNDVLSTTQAFRFVDTAMRVLHAIGAENAMFLAPLWVQVVRHLGSVDPRLA